MNQVFRGNARSKAREVSYDATLDPEEIFHGLLCKLGQICDNRLGGSTVTAFTALHLPNGVQYVFASNRRRKAELDTTKAFIYSVLKSLGDAPLKTQEQQDTLYSDTLKDVLVFNLPRIQVYLGGLANSLNTCIGICETESAEDGKLPIHGTTLPAS